MSNMKSMQWTIMNPLAGYIDRIVAPSVGRDENQTALYTIYAISVHTNFSRLSTISLKNIGPNAR